MSKHWNIFCIAALGALLFGCSSAVPNQVAPGTDNLTRVAYGTSSVSDPDYPRDFVVEAAPALQGKPECGACLAYVKNGLSALGMTSANAESADILVVTADYTMSDETPPRFDLLLNASNGGVEAWRVRTYCFGEAEKSAHYLPGLVAGALPLVGANRPAAAINLESYRPYLEAVMAESANSAAPAEENAQSGDKQQ